MILIHPAMLEDLLITTGYAEGKFVYHIGTEVDMDDGIQRFFEHLDKNGEILINEPETVSYLNYSDKIAHLILYKSLSKLEYLEHMYLLSVDKNENSRKV